MNKKKLIFILISLFILNSSYAATFSGIYNCDFIVDTAPDKVMDDRVTKWFQGYYSGVNLFRGYTINDGDPTPLKTFIFDEIIKYCIDNPTHDNADASIFLYNKITGYDLIK